MIPCLHHAYQSLQQVINILKASGLCSIAIYGNILVQKSLNNEIGYNPTIVGKHIWPIGIENPDDLYSGLSSEEWDELYDIQTQFMIFKNIVAGKSTWKEIIAKLQEQAHFVDELKAKGIENFINVKTNLLEALTSYNAKLGIK